MKIIQVIDSIESGGGVNSFVFDLCQTLKELGHEVTLIGILKTSVKENEKIEKLEKLGIDVYCLNSKSKKDAILYDIKKLRMIIKRVSDGEKTVCNLHLKLSVLMGALSTVGLKNVKCVETYHNMYHHYHMQYWLLYHFIKKYICVSETACNEMKKRFFTPDKKLSAIPNGVSRRKIREISGIDDIKKESNIIKVVSVGRISYEKNFKIVAEALVTICDENLIYTHIGDGPQMQEMKTIVGKNPHMILKGALTREETLQEIAKADIVVMPSLWEGRSILQLEAMALDKPMILSDVDGLRETFNEEKLKDNEEYKAFPGGYLVKTDNIKAYQQSIKEFVSKIDKVEEMKKFISEVSEKNDILNVAEAYIKVYEKILS